MQIPEHPHRYVAGLLLIAAAWVAFIWYVVFAVGVRSTGWSGDAVVNYARYVFTYDATKRLFFLWLAVFPFLCLGLALAYLLGGTQRTPWSWALFLIVCATALGSLGISPWLLACFIPALALAFWGPHGA